MSRQKNTLASAFPEKLLCISFVSANESNSAFDKGCGCSHAVSSIMQIYVKNGDRGHASTLLGDPKKVTLTRGLDFLSFPIDSCALRFLENFSLLFIQLQYEDTQVLPISILSPSF